MTEESDKQADTLLEANWRSNLPPVLQPIAERYGKDAFIIAYNLGGIQEAVALIVRRTRGNNELMNALNFIATSCSTIAHYALEYKKLDGNKIAEIQLDIQRAVALASAVPVENSSGKIILSS